MEFIKQCYRPLFALNKHVNAYLYSIAKYEWIRVSKNQRQFVNEETVAELTDNFNAELSMINRERSAELKTAMNALDSKCREVLTLWANSLRMREIALKMN